MNVPYRRISLFLATGTVLVSFSKEKKAPPNIVFIMSDDHAVKAVSCYGGGMNRTPNIDAIALDGVRFTNACVANSVSGPSRATLLTGKHSHLNGMMANDNSFDGAQLTFPKLLQQAGYATAVIGKWHLNSEPTGFDYWNILPGQGDYYNPDFIEMGLKKQYKGYVTEIITNLCLDWLKKQAGSGKPFCLLMHHKAPHRNWLPAPNHFRDFDGVEFPVPGNFFDDYSTRTMAAHTQAMSITRDMHPGYDLKLTREDAPDSLVVDGMQPVNKRMDASVWAQWLAAYREPNKDFYKQKLSGRDLAVWKYRRYLHDYFATINSLDESVGEVIKYLKDKGLYENTIVVYTSDQGFYLGEHGWFDKRFMYEESLHTPLIIHYPGSMNRKQVCDALVQNIDYAPTFLDLAGLKVPEEMQGLSLQPLLDNPKQKLRDALYYHYYEYPGEHKVKRHLGIRTERYKLIHFYYDVDEWEFYDLEKDPSEMTNVFTDPGYKEAIKTMKARLADLEKQYKVPSIGEELKTVKIFTQHKALHKEVVFAFPPSKRYMKGENVLTDGITRIVNPASPGDLRDWQAFSGTDLDATIDLKDLVQADTLMIGFLDDKTDWIFLPKKIILEVSADGKDYSSLEIRQKTWSVAGEKKIIRYWGLVKKDKIRYVRVRAENYGMLPPGHPGEGTPAWLFADEIILK